MNAPAHQETLSRYCTDGYLFSERARERFVLPDKLVMY